MIAAALLVVLLGLDAGFAGIRAVAGRTGLVRTRGLYLRGGGAGAVLGLGVGAALVAVCARGGASADLEGAARGMLSVYVPYAAAVSAGFFVRALPSTDLRAWSSVAVFGPLTLLRPLVLVAGAVAGAAAGGTAGAAAACAAGAAAALGVEAALEALGPRLAGEPP